MVHSRDIRLIFWRKKESTFFIRRKLTCFSSWWLLSLQCYVMGWNSYMNTFAGNKPLCLPVPLWILICLTRSFTRRKLRCEGEGKSSLQSCSSERIARQTLCMLSLLDLRAVYMIKWIYNHFREYFWKNTVWKPVFPIVKMIWYFSQESRRVKRIV